MLCDDIRYLTNLLAFPPAKVYDRAIRKSERRPGNAKKTANIDSNYSFIAMHTARMRILRRWTVFFLQTQCVCVGRITVIADADRPAFGYPAFRRRGDVP